MIEQVRGNLLEADAEALVNTVNTVGIMGKGIALQFRQAYPEVYAEYRRACAHDELRPGSVQVVPIQRLGGPKYVINVPTKRHWKGKARLTDIDSGLRALTKAIREYGITSVAVPPLGCGNGGLDWRDVEPRIRRVLGSLDGVRVLVYPPDGAPAANRMPVATKRPRMTAVRAAIILLLKRYGMPGYKLSLLEIQKLAYLLEKGGEPLRLDFAKDKFGPYSEKLHHVLQPLEGHYIRGYGDRSANSSIAVTDEAVHEAMLALEGHTDSQQHLHDVAKVIQGFETPYGMELLATVHWVANEDESAAADARAAVQAVHRWNARKRRTFTPKHIEVAWQRLSDAGWLRAGQV
ncbi:MAG: macro domain-containing protein, partial [Pirellulales bacterium]